jgi:hypothetical protein
VAVQEEAERATGAGGSGGNAGGSAGGNAGGSDGGSHGWRFLMAPGTRSIGDRCRALRRWQCR